MADNNVAWACRNCGIITEHPNASGKNIAIRKTTLCLECFRVGISSEAKHDAR